MVKSCPFCTTLMSGPKGEFLKQLPKHVIVEVARIYANKKIYATQKDKT